MPKFTHIRSPKEISEYEVVNFSVKNSSELSGGDPNARVPRGGVGGGADLFLSVGVDEDVVSAPSRQRLVADDTINGTDARYVLLATDAVLQQATVYTTYSLILHLHPRPEVRSIAMSVSVCLSVCPFAYLNRSSAVADTGDRLATTDMGRKVGATVPLSVGG